MKDIPINVNERVKKILKKVEELDLARDLQVVALLILPPLMSYGERLWMY